MGRYPQSDSTIGSKHDLQVLANQFPQILNRELSAIIKEQIHLIWKSPLEYDDYSEYVDKDFIDKLGITPKNQLNTFWPEKGPNWDGLAVSGNKVFIIEAKAHISEMKGEDSTGACEESAILINEALEKTKKYLGVSPDVSWCNKTYYQYANRLAHLYYLRELNGIDAHLLFIYFLNDKTVQKNKTELETKDDWTKAIDAVYQKLHLVKNNKLSKYIHTIYIDVNDINIKE